MNYHQSDPVDHARTFRRHAGESVTYGANAPGLAGAAVAMVAVVVGLFALATEHVPAGTVAVILGAVLGVVSAAWLRVSHESMV